MGRRIVKKPVVTDEPKPPKPSAAERTLPLFRFITCACGLVCSTDIWKQWKYKCQRCSHTIDPNTEGALEPPAQKEKLLPLVEDKYERLPNGRINNCAVANGDDEPNCLMCGGKCPDAPHPDVAIDENGDDILVCEVCGKKLTQTSIGTFYPCGHDARTSQKEPIMARRIKKPTNPEPEQEQEREEETSEPEAEDAVENQGTAPPVRGSVHRELVESEGVNVVTVTWGKELFSPQKFHTYEVGPFTASYTVGPGESRTDVMRKGMNELRKFAEEERKKKRAAYMEALKDE